MVGTSPPHVPSAVPSPTLKPGHLLLQSNVLPGVPGTPVHPPRSPLETGALLGKAPVAKASSGIDTPCPACVETTQFTATKASHPLLNINSGAVQLCKTPCSPTTTTKARSQGLEVPKGSGLIRSWLPHSLPPPTCLTHSLTLPLPLPESWPRCPEHQ